MWPDAFEGLFIGWPTGLRSFLLVALVVSDMCVYIYMMCIYIFLYVICLGQCIETSDIGICFFFSHWLNEGHQSEKTLKAHYKHTHTKIRCHIYTDVPHSYIHIIHSYLHIFIYVIYICICMYIYIYMYIYICIHIQSPSIQKLPCLFCTSAGPAPRAFRKRRVVWGTRHPQESNPPQTQTANLPL